MPSPGGGIYKSTDGGATWKKLSGGLPDNIIQAYVAISRSRPSRLFASVAVPGKIQLYRSDDSGLTWHTVTNDPRPKERIGGGDLPMPAIDPTNPNVFYMTSIVTWKSTDGGHTWHAFRGARVRSTFAHRGEMWRAHQFAHSEGTPESTVGVASRLGDRFRASLVSQNASCFAR